MNLQSALEAIHHQRIHARLMRPYLRDLTIRITWIIGQHLYRLAEADARSGLHGMEQRAALNARKGLRPERTGGAVKEELIHASKKRLSITGLLSRSRSPCERVLFPVIVYKVVAKW